MPYIAIKTFPKDEETKKRVTDKINEIFLNEWGCPKEAITISIEEIPFEEWNEKIVKPEIEPKLDKMLVLNGEKKY